MVILFAGYFNNCRLLINRNVLDNLEQKSDKIELIF